MTAGRNAREVSHGMLLCMFLRQLISGTFLALLAACSSVPTVQQSGAAETDREAQTVPVETLNPDVRQDTIQQTICTPGYTASVRPATTYTNGVKTKLIRDQGLPSGSAADYELDHRIPLALGGHPRNLKNLMLQPWEGDDGAKKKDRLERRLQQLVCAGQLLLVDARRAIYVNWQAAYRVYVFSR